MRSASAYLVSSSPIRRSLTSGRGRTGGEETPGSHAHHVELVDQSRIGQERTRGGAEPVLARGQNPRIAAPTEMSHRVLRSSLEIAPVQYRRRKCADIHKEPGLTSVGNAQSVLVETPRPAGSPARRASRLRADGGSTPRSHPSCVPPRLREGTMGKLDGKVAIVTGAARGLGRAYAKRLAGLGASIAVGISTRALTRSLRPRPRT